MRAALFAILAALVPGVASATTVAEGPDFGDDFATRTLLPAQTDRIQGSVYFDGFPPNASLWDNDFVAFTDLQPGATFSVTALDSFATFAFPLQILDSSGAVVVSGVSIPGNIAGGLPVVLVAAALVPASGELVFGIRSSDLSSFYKLQLDAPRVAPEPGTALLLALGLASLAGARRRTARRD